jgi:mono/diheme cytochrome c family protein
MLGRGGKNLNYYKSTRSFTMKKFTAVVLAAVALFAFVNLRADDAKKDGKAIFTASKCASCHTLDAAGIKKPNGKNDLSGISAKLPADKMEKYLLKEADFNGKKHGMKFAGSKEDLTVLVKWIASFKAEKK